MQTLIDVKNQADLLSNHSAVLCMVILNNALNYRTNGLKVSQQVNLTPTLILILYLTLVRSSVNPV